MTNPVRLCCMGFGTWAERRKDAGKMAPKGPNRKVAEIASLTQEEATSHAGLVTAPCTVGPRVEHTESMDPLR